ncbi:unnamed protein product [Ascophyllum nodosum]
MCVVRSKQALGGRGPCQETRRVHVHRAVSRGRRQAGKLYPFARMSLTRTARRTHEMAEELRLESFLPTRKRHTSSSSCGILPPDVGDTVKGGKGGRISKACLVSVTPTTA